MNEESGKAKAGQVQVQVQSPKKIAQKTEIRRRSRTTNRPLTAEQAQKVIMAGKTHKEQALLVFGFSVGCRVSEARSFTAETIDWQQGLVRIWDSKKRQYRFVMPPLAVLNRIRLLINEEKPGPAPVFDFSTKTIERIFQRCSKQAIGEARSWHTVRHTYISLSAENNINPAIVCQNTGDKPATILQYYTKLSPGYMRKVIEEKPIFSESAQESHKPQQNVGDKQHD